MSMSTGEKNEIKTTVAMLRNFSPQRPEGNAVIYFWESHNKHADEKGKTQATIDLIYKEFDLSTCEKYEVHTGYLSRYNHMLKPLTDCTANEIKKAIVKGQEEQNEWLSRCQPELPGFTEKNWEDCINNRFYEDCRNLVVNKIDNDPDFANAFSKSITDFALTHGTNETNGKLYIVEETSWILTLPLLHLKPIYLIHIGSANSAVVAMFHHFPNLQKAVKWLSPRFSQSNFKNISEFLLDYRNASHVGYSYALENKESVRGITIFRKEEESSRKIYDRLLDDERTKNNYLMSIINKVPVHIYWLDRNMVYMGCNDLQAQRLNLNSKEEIIGKTNYDLHSVEEADELNKVNNTVITTGNLYECEEVVFTKSISKLCNYLSRKIPLVDISGKIIGLLGVSVDITDRKKKEGIEKMLKIKEELYKIATEVAHDIASPVSALRMVQYMSEGKLLEKETKMLNLAIGSIEDMADKLMSRYKVVKNAALKIESKVVDKTDEEYISPYESLQEIVEIMVYRNKEANVEIKCKVDNENKFVFIKGDFSDFSRMMVNLVKNAADALEGKKGIIDVSYKVKREKGKEVEIRVKDNGKGMPKEMAEKLVKGGKIWTTKGKDGHGIGMQQVRGTIKAMNGQLKIESKENVGTEIILTFPKLEKSNMQMEIKKL